MRSTPSGSSVHLEPPSDEDRGLASVYRLCRRVLRFEAKASSHTRPRKQSMTPGPSSRGPSALGDCALAWFRFPLPFQSVGRPQCRFTPFGFCQCAVTVDEGLRRRPAGSEQELASEWRVGGLAAAA